MPTRLLEMGLQPVAVLALGVIAICACNWRTSASSEPWASFRYCTIFCFCCLLKITPCLVGRGCRGLPLLVAALREYGSLLPDLARPREMK